MLFSRFSQAAWDFCIRLRHSKTNAEYAVKFVHPDLLGEQISVDRFYDELKVCLSASMCSFVAEAIAVVRINDSPCVLSPWMPKGDLASALPNLKTHLKFEALVRMVRGLSWVHDKLGVIHRDVKPANVLLDEADLAYVADWGLARPVGHTVASVRSSLNDSGFERLDRTKAGSFLGTIRMPRPNKYRGLGTSITEPISMHLVVSCLNVRLGFHRSRVEPSPILHASISKRRLRQLADGLTKQSKD